MLVWVFELVVSFLVTFIQSFGFLLPVLLVLASLGASHLSLSFSQVLFGVPLHISQDVNSVLLLNILVELDFGSTIALGMLNLPFASILNLSLGILGNIIVADRGGSGWGWGCWFGSSWGWGWGVLFG